MDTFGEIGNLFLFDCPLFLSHPFFPSKTPHSSNIPGRPFVGRTAALQGRQNSRADAALAKDIKSQASLFEPGRVDAGARVTDIQLLRPLQDKMHNLHHLLQIRGANVSGS